VICARGCKNRRKQTKTTPVKVKQEKGIGERSTVVKEEDEAYTDERSVEGATFVKEAEGLGGRSRAVKHADAA
jgi:hypothetical protein